jgi:hypothetical protein
MGRALLTLLVVALVVVAAFALWLRWNEPRMIYFPTRPLDWTPDRDGIAFDDVRLTTADGVHVHAWWLRAAGDTSGGGDSKVGDGDSEVGGGDSKVGAGGRATVLLLHGNAGNIGDRREKLNLLLGLGADVLILDYRGYGLSEGTPDERGTYADARAAYDYLVRSGVAPKRIVLLGESLGSAVGTELARQVEVGGLILEEAFTSMADVGQGMFPFLPVRWLVRNRYDTIAKIGEVRAPILILHSRDDEYFPMRHAERLRAAARAPVALVELRGSHNDAFLTSEKEWTAAVGRMLESVAQPGR